MEINISKIFILDQQPSAKIPNRFWFDLTNNQLKRYDADNDKWTEINVTSNDVIIQLNGEKITLSKYLDSVFEGLTDLDQNKADKSDLTNYLPLTGGTITKDSQWDAQPIVLVEDTYTGFGYTMDSGITVKGSQEHKYDTIISTTSILPNRIIGDAVTDSITPESNKLLTSGGAYTALQSKADKSALNNYLPLTGGEISTNNPDSVIIKNSIVNLLAPSDVGLLVKDAYDDGQDTVILQTHYGANAITGNAVTDSITSGSNKLLTSSGAYTALQGKANDSAVVHLADEETITGTKTFENCDLNIANGLLTIDGINVLSTIQTNSTNIESLSSNKADDNKVVHLAGAETITGSKTFNDGSSYSTTVHSSGVSVTGSGYTTSLDYQGINFNEGRLEGILSDFTSRSSTTVVNSQATYNALLLKQDKEDNSLTTDSKVIVSAINELNAKLLATMPDPITASYTFTSTTGFTSFITNSSYANIQGKVLISPNINNLGAIYVGQSVSNKTNAFPLYPNQIVSLSFTDITNFKCAADVSGDSFNYVVEFGLLNASTTPANGLVVIGTNGSQYRLDPTGDAGSETFTLTKIN